MSLTFVGAFTIPGQLTLFKAGVNNRWVYSPVCVPLGALMLQYWG